MTSDQSGAEHPAGPDEQHVRYWLHPETGKLFTIRGNESFLTGKGYVELRPVSAPPSGPDYRELLREVLEQIDNEPAAEHALGSMESYRKAVGLPYGCAYHRSVGARSCACPPEAEEEWNPMVGEVDDALSVLRDLLAKPFYRLWLPVDIAQRARALVARAGQAGGETRAGSPRVGRDRVEAAARELRILTRCRCNPPYPLVSGRRDPDCLGDWREDVDTLAAALGVAIDLDDEETSDG